MSDKDQTRDEELDNVSGGLGYGGGGTHPIPHDPIHPPTPPTNPVGGIHDPIERGPRTSPGG
jgi:hypothetical protein